MNNKILIEVYVPILEKEYDVFVPINKKIYNLVTLLAEAISDLSNDCLPRKQNMVLFNKINGQLLNPKDTISSAGLVNGSQVIML